VEDLEAVLDKQTNIIQADMAPGIQTDNHINRQTTDWLADWLADWHSIETTLSGEVN